MQRHIEVKKIVKQIRQAHTQQRTVEEMEGLPIQQIQELMSTQFLQEQVPKSIVEQLPDVAESPDVPAVTQRQQTPSKKLSENSWEEIMEVSVPRGMEDAALRGSWCTTCQVHGLRKFHRRSGVSMSMARSLQWSCWSWSAEAFGSCTTASKNKWQGTQCTREKKTRQGRWESEERKRGRRKTRGEGEKVRGSESEKVVEGEGRRESC